MLLAVLIILLLPVTIVGGGFFLLSHRCGVRSAYNVFAGLMLATTSITLFRDENGLSGFLLMETSLVDLCLFLGGVALTIISLRRNEHWRLLSLATGVVGLSFVLTCVEIYRIALQVSAL